MNSDFISPAQFRDRSHIVLSARIETNAAILRETIESLGYVCISAPTVEAVADAIQTNAALVVLSEEVLSTDQSVRNLGECLKKQPEWSDIPVIILLKDCRRFPSCMAFLHDAKYHGSFVLLEMPLKRQEFISVVRTCLRNRQKQYALRDTIERLHQSNRILENFSHIVAHELRNPLSNIVSILELLSRNTLEAEYQKKLLDLGFSSATNMNRTIRALLEYGKLNARDDLTFETIDMERVVEKATLSLKQVIEARQAKVESMKLPEIRGNEQLLIRLTSNLIKNAIVHNSASIPKVRISAELQSDNKWRFEVTDNGSGISPEDQKKIFALFKRVGNNRVEGSGIGLALCRRIVELHRGTVGVRSQLDCGSTFYFELPADTK